MGREEKGPTIIPEARTAYRNEKVLQALRNCNWFTPEYIQEVSSNEPEPERKGLGPFEDRLLGDFFLASLNLNKTDNTVYLGARVYISPIMVGSEGHPKSIKNIPFTDQEILDLAKQYGVDKDYTVDRRMIDREEAMIQCLIAPEEIRRKVVKIICRWGNEKVKTDFLLWAMLTKKGVKQYLESRNLMTPAV